MSDNYDVNCRVMEAKFNEKGFEETTRIGNIEIGDLPEEQRARVQEIIDESMNFGEVRETLEKSGYDFTVLQEAGNSKVFIKDKDIEQVRVINFNDVIDEAERSEEIIPELSDEERRNLYERIRNKEIGEDEAKEQYGVFEEDRNIDDDLNRNNLDFKDEVNLNRMLFEAPDIYAVNNVLQTYGLETVSGDRPYIIEHQSGYETGMKIVFGQETRTINEIADDTTKEAIMSCRDIGEVDGVIKHSMISREDRLSQERTDDEDYRRDIDGPDYSATGRNRTEREREGYDR